MLSSGGHALAVEKIPRDMNNISSSHPATINNLYKRELPDSQGSVLSSVSNTFATTPALHSSSSNVSNSTTVDTDFTSPFSSKPSSQNQLLDPPIAPSPAQFRSQNVHPAPSRIDTTSAPRTGDTAASPMSLDSPVLAQGSKRTASGAVKGLGLSLDGATTATAATTNAHKRTKSTDTGANPRIGELSARLRTRLSYAMVKVENGWEKQSLEELEDQTSQRGSPNSAPGRSEGMPASLETPRAIDRRRRPSGVSENSDQMMLSPGQHSPPGVLTSLATTPSSLWPSAPHPTLYAYANGMPVTSSPNGPILAPAAEIGPRRKRRSSTSFAPPPILGSNQRKHHSDLGGGAPRTPITAPRKPGILRMPSQQAEKDAVDTLLFMSSPNSGRVPHTGMDGQPYPSPLRSEFPGRRVMFENQGLKHEPVDNHHRRQGAPAHYTPYQHTGSTR